MATVGQENVSGNVTQGRAGKSIEQIYQKKTQLEHILLRPDTYVGSVEPQADKMWVFNIAEQKMEFKTITYTPGLYKIFDEILVNAADNAVRDPQGMDTIKVEINVEQGYISVFNNGKGLPVLEHKEHKVMVPELVFGHLLTSDNYDDGEKKVTGGRNGYGAKLTNIFSNKFVVETADCSVGLKYRQEFSMNMTKKKEGVTKKYSGPDYTQITFYPDLKRFGMERLDASILGLFAKRVMDMAGTSSRGAKKGLKVFFQGERVKVRDFADYVDLFLKDREEKIKIHERCSDRWEYVVSISEGQFAQCSFVNSIATTKGGTHVTHVSDQVINAIVKKAQSKNRGGMEIKPFHVKNHIWIFVNSMIENPAFDSQTKDTLTTKQAKFGSKADVSDGFINKVLKSGLVETVLHWAKAKESIDMKRKLKGGPATGNTRVLGVPKLEDANDAGTRNSEHCTLILTEGDSAKSLAVAGLGVIGRDRYGVFPLKGKLLNVRDAKFKQVMDNAEIQNLFKILGLDTGRKYADDMKGLRYGSVMIMTDQDLDGSHIKGLLVNLFDHWWPALLKRPGFLRVFATPIVKVTKGPTSKQFFTLSEYHNWQLANHGGRGWKSKYYKGLGTSTAAEAKEYFKQLKLHEMGFHYGGPEDTEAIDLAFAKKRADDRKTWIAQCEDHDVVDFSAQSVSYHNFIHKELVHFAKYDVHRAIPSMVDGLKPTQRKVLFCSFKRNLRSDLKVAQFVGYVSEQSAYHHGEASLESTIVNLAQDFVGSNNVNFLVPSGQFGTRLLGGKDHASSRYIYTRLAPWTRSFFHEHDDAVLTYLSDEGQSIEPKHYVPVIPAVLVNGCDGIGTGWSSSVPNFNPRDVIANIKKMLAGVDPEPMHPWYQGFSGGLTLTEKGTYECFGTLEKTGDRTIEITELPIKQWTQDYKEFLQDLIAGAEPKPKEDKKQDEAQDAKDDKSKPKEQVTIEDFKEYHTETTVHFVVTLTPEKMMLAEQQGLEKVFKVRRAACATTNMVLFDHQGKIRRYADVLEILHEFFKYRMQVYRNRKDDLCEKLYREKMILDNKVRFLLMVIENQLVISKKKKKVLIQELVKHKFKTWAQIQAMSLFGDREPEEEDMDEESDDEDDEKQGKGNAGFNYLLKMPLWNLTYEKVEKLKETNRQKTVELKDLQMKPVEDIWQADLKDLVQALDERDELIAKANDKAKKLVVQKTDVVAGAEPKRRKKKGDDTNDFAPPAAPREVPKAAQQRTVVQPGAAQAAQARAQEAQRAAAARGAQASAWTAPEPEPAPPPVRTEPMSLMERLKARGAAGGAFSSGAFDFFSDAAPAPAPAPSEPAGSKRPRPDAGASDTPSKVAQPPKQAAEGGGDKPKRRGRKPKAKGEPAKIEVATVLDSDDEVMVAD